MKRSEIENFIRYWCYKHQVPVPLIRFAKPSPAFKAAYDNLTVALVVCQDAKRSDIYHELAHYSVDMARKFAEIEEEIADTYGAKREKENAKAK